MEFSWQFRESMVGVMWPSTVYETPPSNEDIHFDKNEAHLRWFSFKKIEEGVPFEVPACVIGIVSYDINCCHSDELVVPIYKSTTEKVVAGAETMLKVFSRQFFSEGLIKVVTTKGEVYYGCKGLILDKDFNILLMVTFQGMVKDGAILYNKRLVHINPLVFTNDDAILNKSLARKVIPFILSTPVRVPDYSNRSGCFSYSEECSDGETSIVIDNVTSWMKVPSKPKDPINTREELNKFINQNISDVLTQMKDDFRVHFQ